MAHLDAAVALTTVERALRQLMEHAYRKQFGDSWLERISTTEQRTKWSGLAEEEQKKRGRRGVSQVPGAGLDYVHMHDLREIVRLHWDPLAEALKGQTEVLVLLKRFDDLRNTVAHSRSLVSFEEDLLAGIAGDIRNRVAIYMSKQDPHGEFFPRIESVQDHLGNEPTSTQLINPERVANCFPDVILRPGDVVQFQCSGVDPQGRQLEWTYSKSGILMWRNEQIEVGADVTLTWEVQPQDVAGRRSVHIFMRAADTPYHRIAQGYDHAVAYTYQVLPPG